MKNLIVSFAVGYQPNDVEPFVNSCARNSPNTDIILFTGNNIKLFQQYYAYLPQVKFYVFKQNLIAKIIAKILKRSYSISTLFET